MDTPHAVIEHLVSLTALRDREQLDKGLALALRQVLPVRSVGVYRLIDSRQGARHWFKCALASADGSLSSDPSWVDPASLPAQEDEPLRQQVLDDPVVLQVPADVPAQAPAVFASSGSAWLCLMPLMVDHPMPMVVEVLTDQSLSTQHVQTAQTFLRVFDNYLRLLDASQRDPLTGLLNRQTFDTSFLAASLPRNALELGHDERRRQVGDQWWLGVVDIDHFKRVNDRFGHLIGDEVLVLVARVMRQTFRLYDRLFRFGGEEFVVMLRCPEESGAVVAFERFRQRMQDYVFPQVGQVTVSVGFTQVLPTDAPSAAFSRADEAVYQAKHQGRNRVLSHRALVQAGAVVDTSHEGDVELF